MKKLILALSVMTSPLLVQAAVNPPRDQKGTTIPSVDFVGAIPYDMNSATGTTAVLVASGRAIVYGVVCSSITYTNYLVLRDSATANSTSSTATIVYAQGSNATVAASVGSYTSVIKFPVPIRFTNGISANLSAAPTNTTTSWTILYRPMNATE